MKRDTLLTTLTICMISAGAVLLVVIAAHEANTLMPSETTFISNIFTALGR